MANFRETPWQRIIEVGWASGGVVIVEVTAPETKFYEVTVLTPPGGFMNFFSGAAVVEADYQAEFVLQMGIVGSAGTVLVEDALTDIWIWDDWSGIDPIGADNTEQIALKTASAGYAPNLHLTGQGVKSNPLSLPPQTSELGDLVLHTHPNGSTVQYRSGYTALSQDGAFVYTNMETWYWYRVLPPTAPGYAAVLRKSFLVNFRKDFALTAELRDFVSGLAYPLTWSVKGYPSGTGFTVADGVMTPSGAVPTTFSASGSVAGGHEGAISAFNGRGLI